MPYKSLAQAAKFHAMLARGQIDPGTVAEWDAASKGLSLPKRAAKPKGKKMAGKSMKLGGGGRFAALKKKIAAKGNVRNAGAVAAAIGRKKYGAAKFQALAAGGRKRAKKKA